MGTFTYTYYEQVKKCIGKSPNFCSEWAKQLLAVGLAGRKERENEREGGQRRGKKEGFSVANRSGEGEKLIEGLFYLL